MTHRWIPYKPKTCQKHVQQTIRNLSKYDLWLPSELPQLTPETPIDHQQMSNETQQCQTYVWVFLGYLWIIHEKSKVIHGLFMTNSHISLDYQFIDIYRLSIETLEHAMCVFFAVGTGACFPQKADLIFWNNKHKLRQTMKTKKTGAV